MQLILSLNMEFDFENPLTILSEYQPDTISTLFSKEQEHMPSEIYFQMYKTRDLQISSRQEAISLILKCSSNFDPFIPYLAINYLDRFIFKEGIPQGKEWIISLVSISCLSVAAKMKNTEFSLSDFQTEGFIFDTQTIQRMELLILGALNWRMRSITPFSFIYFFISLIKIEDLSSKQSLKARTAEIILKSQNEISFLDYRPSIIAAAALLSASQELFPLFYPCFRKAISACSYINKEKLFSCYDLIEDITINGYEKTMSDVVGRAETPVNVLDLHCLSSESEKSSPTMATTGRTLEPTAQTVHLYQSGVVKRRKLNDFGNKTIQLSQVQQC